MKRSSISFCTLAALAFGLSSSAIGQVFTQADGAVEGPAQSGQGQALYGSFGLNSADDPEFNIYRKYSRQESDEPLSSASNVAGNPGEAEWINVNQRQSGTLAGQPNHVLTAPGMFIGTKNHRTDDGWTVSNPDEVLYFKPLIDNSGDVDTADSQGNAFWDTRFGFMESPQDYIDFAEPNSGQLDLWTGEFQTDAVYLQSHIDRDDSTSEEVLQRTGHGGSFKVHAASSQFDDERGRRNNELIRTQAGTGEEQELGGFIDAGVAYGDPIEVTWGMRLNDPENGDEVFAREVEFWVKTGNLISGGVFDPGGGPNGEFPFETPNDDLEDFSDVRFDWENAIPVFFAGAEGLAQGTGGMGIFTPGDFGADGSVNLDDFNRLAANFGTAGTTYSRGDLNQDGITDLVDATAWSEVADDSAKSAAVGAVEADVAAGGTLYDFDGSGSTDAADVSLISDLFGVVGGGECVPSNGDIDGNSRVEFADFLVLSTNFGQEADAAGGDIDCNGSVEFSDFLVLSTNFGQEVAAASVPEPNGILILLTGLLSASLLRKRR